MLCNIKIKGSSGGKAEAVKRLVRLINGNWPEAAMIRITYTSHRKEE